jgi:hypothetical protein
MSLSPDTKTAVLRRFVAGQRARRRRLRVLVAVVVAALVAIAGVVVAATRDDPSDARAARFVDAISYGQRGHLRIARLEHVDVIVYDSSEVLSWIVAYGEGRAGRRVCLEGEAVAGRCFGSLREGENGTVHLSWAGRSDLAMFTVVELRDADGAVVARGTLRKRTG